MGKYFRLAVGNDWHFLSTPSVQFLWGDWDWCRSITLRFLGAWASVIYYPNGDSHDNMFSTEFYEEDYDEADYEDCDCDCDEPELTKENIALRDVVG